jgi:HSP20 family protein
MALRQFFSDDFFGRNPAPWWIEPRDPFADFMPMTVFPHIERDPFMVLRRSSPGYEIHEDDNKFQLSIDVPGCKPDDITVNLEQDGRLLHLSGGRKVEKDGSMTETRFDKRFTLAENIDTTNISANLADGVLVVTAPKKELPKLEAKSIPILAGPAPSIGKIEAAPK